MVFNTNFAFRAARESLDDRKEPGQLKQQTSGYDWTMRAVCGYLVGQNRGGVSVEMFAKVANNAAAPPRTSNAVTEINTEQSRHVPSLAPLVAGPPK